MYKKDFWYVIGLLEEIEKASDPVTTALEHINSQAKEALTILRGYDGNNV